MASAMFKVYLAKLNAIAQVDATHENFVEIQRIRDGVLNAHNEGKLHELEKRTLNNLSLVIMNNMREDLGLSRR